MSEKIDRRRVAFQKFFDAVNEGVWENIESTMRELATPDFILHTVSKPGKERTLDEFLEDYKRSSEELSNQKVTIVNWFSAGDMIAGHIVFEATNKHTNEKHQGVGFFVDRFEGDKTAEEWEWDL